MEENEVSIQDNKLIQSVLSTALTMIEIQDALEREFNKNYRKFDLFYETNFKEMNLIDKVLDLYTKMYSSIEEAEWPKITSEIQEEITGVLG
jgi:hypothetical protein